MLAFMVAHQRPGVGCFLEKFHDLGSFRPTVDDIADADQGFRLTFSASPFPGYQKQLTWVRGDATGNWYRTEDPPMEGWLCPGLFKYYRDAPKELYVKAEPKSDQNTPEK